MHESSSPEEKKNLPEDVEYDGDDDYNDYDDYKKQLKCLKRKETYLKIIINIARDCIIHQTSSLHQSIMTLSTPKIVSSWKAENP